ncbi:14031_t:CDS:2, partial [Rhizophagus irregularis]
TVFPTHFVTRRVQCLQSPRSDLFHLPFSRTLRTRKPWMDLRQENVLLKNKLKAVQKGAELEQQPWEPSPKKQKIMTHGTATLFAGEKILVGLDSFKEIVDRGSTIIDKTLLISEFIECKGIVSLVVRPRRFGKTINLTMLREFFSIPIHPDNKDYRYELFKDTKIMERSDVYNKYFCKYPVIFLSLKGYESCSTWSSMRARLCQQLATLYNDHHYVYYQVSQKILNKSRFDRINSGKFKDGVTEDALLYLSKYLKDYHRNKCIVLIDEYDHPLEVAYQHQYYEEACGFFASLFGALLKGNDENLEKALLVGVSRVAKSGYLSGLNNLQVFPMHHEVFANYFGFTEDEIFILLQHNGKEDQLDGVRQWYNGYRAGNGLNLYNPWSIISFINEGTLKAHWIDTGGTKTIKDLLWNSTEDFKNNTSMLLKGCAINVRIMEDMDYNVLAQKSNIDNVLWTLLYYAGYLTKDKNDNLCIPNMEVSTEWQEWLTNCNSFELDSMLSLLLQCRLSEFKEQFSRFIMNSLSYYDVTDKMAETNYHVFIIGLFNQAYCRGYKLISNREAGTGRFDLKIEPTEKVNFKTGVFMEFKVLKNEKQNKKKLQDKANEALEQIKNKRYFSDLPKFTKQCVICGVAFQGKDVYIASE